MKKNPNIAALKKRNQEVLLFDRPLDEFAFQEVRDYEGKKLTNIAKGVQFEETEEEKKISTQIDKDFKPLTSYVRTALKGIVNDVKLNNNLIEDPCVVTSSAFGVSINQEKIYRAQTMGDASYFKSDKTMELNPNHSSIQTWLGKVKEYENLDAGDEKENLKKELDDIANL